MKSVFSHNILKWMIYWLAYRFQNRAHASPVVKTRCRILWENHWHHCQHWRVLGRPRLFLFSFSLTLLQGNRRRCSAFAGASLQGHFGAKVKPTSPISLGSPECRGGMPPAAITRSIVVFLLGCRFSYSRLPDTYRRRSCGSQWKARLSRTRFAERLWCAISHPWLLCCDGLCNRSD